MLKSTTISVVLYVFSCMFILDDWRGNCVCSFLQGIVRWVIGDMNHRGIIHVFVCWQIQVKVIYHAKEEAGAEFSSLGHTTVQLDPVKQDRIAELDSLTLVPEEGCRRKDTKEGGRTPRSLSFLNRIEWSIRSNAYMGKICFLVLSMSWISAKVVITTFSSNQIGLGQLCLLTLPTSIIQGNPPWVWLALGSVKWA